MLQAICPQRQEMLMVEAPPPPPASPIYVCTFYNLIAERSMAWVGYVALAVDKSRCGG